MNEEFIVRDGTLVHYTGNDFSIVIPDNVTAIGSHAFRGCINLEKIAVPNSCVIIRNEAFAECPNLKTVIIRGMEINMTTDR